MENIQNSPLFAIVLTIGAYLLGEKIQQKTKLSFANPLLLAILMVMAFIIISKTRLETYQSNTQLFEWLLGPATMCLGIVVYRQRALFMTYWKAILGGSFIGALTSLISVIALSLFFHLDEVLIASLIPKSVTTPIAMSISEALGGILPVTVSMVILSGILGSAFGPTIIKLLHSHNAVANGMAYGISAHALGSAKALKSGEIEGAMASIALLVNGLFTVFIGLCYTIGG